MSGGCQVFDGGVICSPRTFNWRTRWDCPTCGRKRWALVEQAVWYGATITCLGCGDAWCEEGRMGRPFARGWRPQAIKRAKQRAYTTKAEAMAALRAEIDIYTQGAA